MNTLWFIALVMIGWCIANALLYLFEWWRDKHWLKRRLKQEQN